MLGLLGFHNLSPRGPAAVRLDPAGVDLPSWQDLVAVGDRLVPVVEPDEHGGIVAPVGGLEPVLPGCGGVGGHWDTPPSIWSAMIARSPPSGHISSSSSAPRTNSSSVRRTAATTDAVASMPCPVQTSATSRAALISTSHVSGPSMSSACLAVVSLIGSLLDRKSTRLNSRHTD